MESGLKLLSRYILPTSASYTQLVGSHRLLQVWSCVCCGLNCVPYSEFRHWNPSLRCDGSRRPLGDNLVMRVEHSLMGLLPLQEAAKELPNYFSVTWGQSRGEKIISKSGWKYLSRNQPCWNSNCRLIASRSVRNKGLFKTKQNSLWF